MRQAQRCFKRMQQSMAGDALLRLCSRLYLHFGKFNIPIAVFIPDKLINRLCNQIKAEIGKVFFNRRTDSLQRGEYPAVCAGLSVLNVALIFRIALVVRTMYEYKARRIPKFVAEIAISLAARQIEIDIAPGRRERCTSEAHCIGAERRDAIGECSARFLAIASLCFGLNKPWVRFSTRASRAIPSIKSIGSSVLPFDLDIFWPCASRTSPCT